MKTKQTAKKYEQIIVEEIISKYSRKDSERSFMDVEMPEFAMTP
jgi:hypothetical protein